MKICIVSAGYPPSDWGGISTYSANLAESLHLRGHSVTVLTELRGETQLEETRSGVRILRLRRRALPKFERFFPGALWSLTLAAKIAQLNFREGLDVVEFPNWEAPGLFYSRISQRVTVVIRAHTPFFETLAIDKAGQAISFEDRVTCWQEQTACAHADLVVASTRFHANMMEAHYAMQEGAIRVVPLGIDVTPFRRNAGRAERPFRILYVSRLEKRKGTQTLLDAIPHVIACHPNVEFVLVGHDRRHAPGGRTYAEYFRAEYPQHATNVNFVGSVSSDALYKWYGSSDLFVVPSVYESFGLIYLEAMAAGLAVIGGRAGGIPEVVSDGETGFLVEPNDTTELARKIVQLISDAALRDLMGKSGLARVEQYFSRETMAINAERAYRSAIETRRLA